MPESSAQPEKHSAPRALQRAGLLVAAIAFVLGAGTVAVIVQRGVHATTLDAATQIHAKQYVTTTKPASGGAGLPLTLPGTLQGVTESTLYARSSGYVLRWTKDIGAIVKKGDLLAEISAPEVDQQLSQSIADEQLAASSESLAKSTAERWQSLRMKDAVTQQDLDERLSAYQQAQSNLSASRANVARLRNLQGFNRVLAPFDGVVTSRNVDVGDLVDAGNGGAGKALFTVAQLDPLRLYVFVPQAYASQIKVGDHVMVGMAQSTERYAASIARTAGAIDSATRTMQVEIRVPNPKGELIAGSYVQVTLPIKQDSAALVVPTNVLLFRPDGTRVATVGENGRVHLNLVRLGTDYGGEVAVLSGLGANDRVVVNPPDSLADGDVVTVRDTPAKGE